MQNKQGIEYSLIYKESSVITEEDKDVIDELQSKNYKEFKVGSKLVLDNTNYNIRFNIKNEVEFDKRQKSFKTGNKNLKRKANLAWAEYTKFLKSNNNKFSELYKTFRLKNRYSFIYNNNRIDMTIVRSSLSDINNFGKRINIPVKEFIDARVLEQEKKYEVELELNINKNYRMPYNLSNLENDIEFICTNFSTYPILISNKEQEDIRIIYKELIKKKYLDLINSKKNTIDSIKLYNKHKLDDDEDKARVIFEKYKDNIYFKKIIETNIDTDNLLIELNKLEKDIQRENYPYNSDSKYFIRSKVIKVIKTYSGKIY